MSDGYLFDFSSVWIPICFLFQSFSRICSDSLSQSVVAATRPWQMHRVRWTLLSTFSKVAGPSKPPILQKHSSYDPPVGAMTHFLVHVNHQTDCGMALFAIADAAQASADTSTIQSPFVVVQAGLGLSKQLPHALCAERRRQGWVLVRHQLTRVRRPSWSWCAPWLYDHDAQVTKIVVCLYVANAEQNSHS